MNRADLLSHLIARKKLSEKSLVLDCDECSIIPYRDVLELYMRMSGVSSWKWQDSLGQKAPPESLRGNLQHLCRDAVRWPLEYGKHWRQIHGLQTNRAQPLGNTRFAGNGNALFLRTDHWFGLKSGGSVGHVCGVIQGFRAVNRRTVVISSDRLPGVSETDDFHLLWPDYSRLCNLPNMPELAYTDQVVRFATQHWQEWNPGFVYQRYSLGNYAGARLRSIYGIPFVCEYNGSFIWVSRNWDARKLFHERLLGRVEAAMVNCADLIVVVSRELKGHLHGYGVHEDKILVNPNGVDPERYSPHIDGSAVRKQFGLCGKVVIGFIGTFGPWHGAQVLAEAFCELLHSFPEYRTSVRLLMIGDGPGMPQVRTALANGTADTECVLPGSVPQDDGPRYLAATDILVAPHVPNPDGSEFFGSPTKLFEYMAMGKGIVASDLNQIGEVLRNRVTALLVKPGDKRELMYALKALIDDRGYASSLGTAARKEVLANYTWGDNVRRTLAALDSRMKLPCVES